MGTNGLVSIVRGKEVLFKIITGSNGMQAPELAKKIRQIDRDEIMHAEGLYQLARHVGFGSHYSLVVLHRTGVYHELEDYEPGEIAPEYHWTFDDPRFNPRWWEGISAFKEIVNLSAEPVPEIPLVETQNHWRREEIRAYVKGKIGLEILKLQTIKYSGKVVLWAGRTRPRPSCHSRRLYREQVEALMQLGLERIDVTAASRHKFTFDRERPDNLPSWRYSDGQKENSQEAG